MERALSDTSAKVLVAEDDEYLRNAIASSIRELGHTVESVADGGRLLVTLAQALKRERLSLPDLIVSDVRMPVMSGLSMAIAIASLERTIPVILVTAFPDEELARRVQPLSFVHILGKPFELHTLQGLVSTCLSARRPASGAGIQLPRT